MTLNELRNFVQMAKCICTMKRAGKAIFPPKTDGVLPNTKVDLGMGIS